MLLLCAVQMSYACPIGTLIDIQPYGNWTNRELMQLQKDLDKYLFPLWENTVEVLPSKQLPQSTYYKPRNRYRAEKILGHLKTNSKDFCTIGITKSDISTSIHGHKDYGIMGLSFRPGTACICSTYRLKNKRNLYKLVIHEFLHSRGLPHCQTKGCYMKDCGGKNAIESSSFLCKSCKAKLL